MTQSIQATGEEFFHPPGRKMGQWVDRVMGGGHGTYSPGKTSWSPAINVYEDAEQYWLVADLAGINADETDLRVDNNVLIIEGARVTPPVPQPVGQVQVRLMEIDAGRFRRQLELPEDADIDGIEATYRCGLLWVRVPRATRTPGFGGGEKP